MFAVDSYIFLHAYAYISIFNRYRFHFCNFPFCFKLRWCKKTNSNKSNYYICLFIVSALQRWMLFACATCFWSVARTPLPSIACGCWGKTESYRAKRACASRRQSRGKRCKWWATHSTTLESIERLMEYKTTHNIWLLDIFFWNFLNSFAFAYLSTIFDLKW